jgi:NAD-dependent dihydropyrimidine dehydrogenase PreA subunit/DNA-binding transcriptional ArsR family regulator
MKENSKGEEMSTIDPLYHELAARLKRPKSKVLPELLQRLVTLEQAKILSELPSQPEEIAKKLGLDQESVKQQLNSLFEKGVVTLGKRGWNMVPSWLVLHDLTGSSDSKFDDKPYFDLAMAMSREEIQNLADKVAKGDAVNVRQGMRVVPKWKTIHDIPGVLPNEEMRTILKNAPPIVIFNCTCKTLHRGRQCKNDLPREVCLGFGRLGEYILARGSGRELTLDEAMKFFDKMEEYPLINLTDNTNRMPLQMCHCHNCCCGMFHIYDYTKPTLNQSPIAKSRFIVELDPGKCLGCGTCVDRCTVKAISLKEDGKSGKKQSATILDDCLGCGLCVLTCPGKARKMKLVRPPDHIPAPGDPGASNVELGDLTG